MSRRHLVSLVLPLALSASAAFADAPQRQGEPGSARLLPRPPQGAADTPAPMSKPPVKEATVSDFEKYVTIETSTPGDGKTFPRPGDTVTCHYTLTVNGAKVDSSRDRKQPFEFQIGRGMVIKGWDEGLLTFSKGQRGVVTIQYQYGYGERGRPPQIPPKATLVFDVELLAINGK